MIRFIIFLFLDVVAFSGVLVATLPFVINNFGGSVLLITVAFGLFSFFQFFVSPFWGNLSDKIGRKPLLILNCGAELIANILLAIATSLPIIFLARIIEVFLKQIFRLVLHILQISLTKKIEQKEWDYLV